jgi:hypothetical protein
MSRGFPLTVKQRRRGRPAKSGPRHPAGRLKEAKGPNPRLIEIRRSIADDVTAAENPLAAAAANGWLTDDERQAGKAFALVCARADLGGPRVSRSRYMEAMTAEERAELALSEAELSALWDQAPGGAAPLGPEARAAAALGAMAAWTAIAAEAAPAAWAELVALCAREEWPTWLLRRLARQALRREDERRLRLLREGLAAVTAVLSPKQPPPGPTPAPVRAPPMATSVTETADYVTPGGELLFKVEQRGRR